MLRKVIMLAGMLLASVASAQDLGVKPDVIFMLADDYGAREQINIPTANGDIIRKVPASVTPNIDAIAAAGVTYTNFYAAPVCVQARVVLMAGRWQQRESVGKVDNNGPQPPPSVVMIPEMLKPLGYTSKIIGKWHLGVGARSPVGQGFDYWYGFVGVTPKYVGHDPKAPLVEQKAPALALRQLQNTGNVTDTLATKAVQLLQEPGRTKPMFLYVAFTATHNPLGGTLESVARKMDQAVGRIVAAARPGTLIFFAGDNGRFSNAPLRGKKYDIYEGGVRTPFVLRWDGRLPAGAVRPGVAGLVDIAPTILAAVGGPAPVSDGINLFAGAIPPDRPLFLDAMYSNPDSAVRIGNWKFFAGAGLNNPRLYDLWTDPGESVNRWAAIQASNPAFANLLRAHIVRFRAALNDRP